jgi:hypothetical protein
MFPIMPLLDDILKWESVHEVTILGKDSNNQIKMNCEFVYKFRFYEG